MTRKNVLAIVIGSISVVFALIIVDLLAPEKIADQPHPPFYPPVSTLNASPSGYVGKLTLIAATTSRWPVQLKATTSARLEWLDPALEPGKLIKKGTLLAKLDATNLKSDLALAERDLKQAQLNLEKVQHEQAVILKTRASSKSSPFARLEPQISAAKADLNYAKRFYASASKALEDANITAPFDAVIVQRKVSPEEWLEAGQVLFELAASDSLDIKLPISEFNWNKVKKTLGTLNIEVVDRTGNRWPANVRNISPALDTTTRQRQITLFVKEPYRNSDPLLSNQQVEVKIKLDEEPNIVSLPASALTRDGQIWTLDENNKLQKEDVELFGEDLNTVFVRFKRDSTVSRRVVAYPLLSMQPGKQVAPNLLPETVRLESRQ